jgi:isoquinoline 1-oxidoreductase beta subunit
MKLDRRGFLQVSLAGGELLLGISLLGCNADQPPPIEHVPDGVRSPLDTWIIISADDMVTLRINRSEMGQGVYTSLAMILAEELDADWSRVRAEHAPVEPTTYGDQATRLSNAVMDNYPVLRLAGAAARQMLIMAAAARWHVAPETCRTERSVVIHPDGARLRYGELLAEAATMPVPADPALKAPSSFVLIGKPIPRLDTLSKLRGEAVYGIDVALPGLLTAVVARCPIFGGTLKKFEASAARAVPGVVSVLEIPSGIAVVAEHFWAAKKGRDALEIEWDPGTGKGLATAAIVEALRDAADHGKDVRRQGDPTAVVDKASRRLEAVYEVPYLAAAPMEPLNCTAHVQGDQCEIWGGTQVPVFTQKAAADLTGLPVSRVHVHVTQLGGGFGRRKQVDFAAEAVQLSMALKRPIKVIWTMEDGIGGGWYRPAACNKLRGAVDAEGRPIAWIHRIAAQPLPSIFEPTVADGVDKWAIQGAVDLPYAIPDIQVTYAMPPPLPVPAWFWRAIGHTYTAFATECFFDELCALGGRDPLATRLELLTAHPRHRRVLELAAEKAQWGHSPPAGRARGLAVHTSFGSLCAQVAEVSIVAGKPRIHKIVCAIDCGNVINPNTVAAQMESCIIYALSATLYGRIDIADGRAVQSNYDDYKILRLPEVPVIEVHIIAAGDPLGGIGEPGFPPTAPAVCNALRALTGEPVRKLPLMA